MYISSYARAIPDQNRFRHQSKASIIRRSDAGSYDIIRRYIWGAPHKVEPTKNLMYIIISYSVGAWDPNRIGLLSITIVVFWLCSKTARLLCKWPQTNEHIVHCAQVSRLSLGVSVETSKTFSSCSYFLKLHTATRNLSSSLLSTTITWCLLFFRRVLNWTMPHSPSFGLLVGTGIW